MASMSQKSSCKYAMQPTAMQSFNNFFVCKTFQFKSILKQDAIYSYTMVIYQMW